jgi:hypothetical protein
MFKISNSAQTFSNITVSNVNGDTVESDNVTAQNITADNILSSGVIENTLIAYAPTSFSSPTFVNSSINLLNVPNGADATNINDTRLAVLPINAIITRAIVDNNGVTVTPTVTNLNLGLAPFTFPATNPNPLIFQSLDDTELANTQIITKSSSASGGFNVTITSSSIRYVSLHNTTATVITGGDLRIFISYLSYI